MHRRRFRIALAHPGYTPPCSIYVLSMQPASARQPTNPRRAISAGASSSRASSWRSPAGASASTAIRVYLAELTRLYGWPPSLIAGASTATYLLNAVLVIFTSNALARFGARRFVLFGVAALTRCDRAARARARALAGLRRLSRDVVRLARPRPRHHPDHHQPVVHAPPRPRDLAGAQRRELRRHRGRALARRADPRRGLHVGDADRGGRDGGDPRAGDLPLDTVACGAGSARRSRVRLDAARRAAQRAVLDRVGTVRAGADRAGRLHRAPDRLHGADRRACAGGRSRCR